MYVITYKNKVSDFSSDSPDLTVVMNFLWGQLKFDAGSRNTWLRTSTAFIASVHIYVSILMYSRARCVNTMNHLDEIEHQALSGSACKYQHQFDNKVYLCKVRHGISTPYQSIWDWRDWKFLMYNCHKEFLLFLIYFNFTYHSFPLTNKEPLVFQHCSFFFFDVRRA